MRVNSHDFFVANVRDGHLHKNYIVIRFAGSFLWRYFVEVTVMKLIRESLKTHRKIVFCERETSPQKNGWTIMKYSFHERETPPRKHVQPSWYIVSLGVQHHQKNMFKPSWNMVFLGVQNCCQEHLFHESKTSRKIFNPNPKCTHISKVNPT